MLSDGCADVFCENSYIFLYTSPARPCATLPHASRSAMSANTAYPSLSERCMLRKLDHPHPGSSFRRPHDEKNTTVAPALFAAGVNTSRIAASDASRALFQLPGVFAPVGTPPICDCSCSTRKSKLPAASFCCTDALCAACSNLRPPAVSESTVTVTPGSRLVANCLYRFGRSLTYVYEFPMNRTRWFVCPASATDATHSTANDHNREAFISPLRLCVMW